MMVAFLIQLSKFTPVFSSQTLQYRTYSEVLEKPGPHNVCSNLWKDASLLLLPRQTRLRIVVH